MDREILQKAIDMYGCNHQVDVTIEEMSELIKAICKFKRKAQDVSTMNDAEAFENLKPEVANVIEEIADVEIMVQQMKMMFGCDAQVEEVIAYKINRLNERMESEVRIGNTKDN